MTIADRISELRKAEGFSQEELAEKTGVSRQAVSKWESEQSMPDMYNIITLSEVFGVTTDYLLKGIEPENLKPRGPISRYFSYNAYTVAATAMIFFGLFLSVLLYLTTKNQMTTLVGFVIITLGIMTFMIGTTRFKRCDQLSNAFAFLRVNVWPIAFFVFSLIYNAILGSDIAPYPIFFGIKAIYDGVTYFNGKILTDSQISFITTVAPAFFVIIYTLFCALATYILTYYKNRGHRGE